MRISFNPIVSNNNQKRQIFKGALADSFVKKVQQGYDCINVIGSVGENCLAGRLTKAEAVDILNKIKNLIPKSDWDVIDNAMAMIKNA